MPSPKFDLPYITSGQASKHVTHNDALKIIDMMVGLTVLSQALTAPPGSPVDGDAYIVATGATGAWLGWDLDVAYRIDGVWKRFTPTEGFSAWDQDTTAFLLWDGTTWIPFDGGPAGPPGVSPVINLSSTTSITIGASGTKTATYPTTDDIGLVIGSRVRFFNSVGNYMEGVVSAVSPTSISMTADLAFGSGTFSSWSIMLTGEAGGPGATGAAAVMSVASTDTRTIGTGSKTFNYSTTAGLGFAVGQRVRAFNSVGNFMEGLVTTTSSTATTIDVDYTEGSGSFSSWTLSIAGEVGVPGTAGAAGVFSLSSSSSIVLSASGTKTATYASTPDIALTVGNRVRFYNGASTYMDGIVTAVSSTSISMTADFAVGSGTLSSWTISLTGERGAAGSAIPAGGTTGQVLTKNSPTDGDAGWATPSGGGSGIQDLGFVVPLSGEYIRATNSASSGNNSTVGGIANRIELYQFTPRRTFTADRIACAVTTGAGSAQGKIAVYDSDSNGRPNNLVLETAALDFSTSGTKEATISQTFTAGQTYWIGVRHSSTATLSQWPSAAVPDINGLSPATLTAAKSLRRSITFASGSTDPWVWDSTEIVSNSPCAIWFRAA